MNQEKAFNQRAARVINLSEFDNKVKCTSIREKIMELSKTICDKENEIYTELLQLAGIDTSIELWKIPLIMVTEGIEIRSKSKWDCNDYYKYFELYYHGKLIQKRGLVVSCVELANRLITPDADKILYKKGVHVIPD